MRILLGDHWKEGYLDEYRTAGQIRVQAVAWRSLFPIRDMYIARQRDWRIIWNYLREIGPQAVIRKVISRTREGARNQRFLSIGLGYICESVDGVQPAEKCPVVFIAPSHPRCMERIVLLPQLTHPVDMDLIAPLEHDEGIVYMADEQDEMIRGAFGALEGWNVYSGRPLDDTAPSLLKMAADLWRQTDGEQTKLLPLPEPSAITEVSFPASMGNGQKLAKAVLFGLGNHAKTVLIPNLDPQVHLTRIHEIDPTQIDTAFQKRYFMDTCPVPRDDDGFDIYFIAGYHHTHADLAIEALKKGAWAVVEKPLLTTRDQLQKLLPVVRANPGKIFVGYHMRYNPHWALARQDLQHSPDQPIHYKAIVYETKLPRLHWYTWPNSCSRVVSNCCHWLDHFLFMNDYAPVVRHDLWLGSNNDLHMSVELENGAVLGLLLTDEGSSRIGVQDTIELRAGQTTVRVRNTTHYLAEDARRVLRHKRVNKIKIYKQMYRQMTARILAGEPGDSIESIERSCTLMLEMEKIVRETVPEGQNLW
jgi:predicted dehydrogenase